MANERSKIERLGLVNRVDELLKTGVTVGKRIGAILREEGHVISDAAVNRYLAPLRDTLTDDAMKVMRKHVDEVLPEDLRALESMESICLGWVNEPLSEQMERIAIAATEIMSEVDDWVEMFNTLNSEPATRKGFVKNIVQKCLTYITRDARMQNKRIQAMNMATKIIELKLRNAGLLTDEGKGRIVIGDGRMNETDADTDGNKKPAADGYKPCVIPFRTPESTGGFNG